MELLEAAGCLQQVPMFARMDSARLKLLAFTSETLQFNHGEALFQAGDAADCAYVIMAGDLEIIAETAKGEVVVGVLHANQLVGEMAVLSNAPRSATIRARGTAKVLKIADKVFVQLLTENPEVALDVMRQLSDKLALAHRQYEQVQNELQQLRNVAAGV